jgi:hypothetical protein
MEQMGQAQCPAAELLREDPGAATANLRGPAVGEILEGGTLW